MKHMNLKNIKSYMFPMIEGEGDNGGGGGGTTTMPEFNQQLEENLRGDERLTQFGGKTISDVVRGHFEQGDRIKTLEGAQEGLVRIPDENTSAEERAVFLKAYGRPDNPSEYEISKPEELPPGMEHDEAFLTAYKNAVHVEGLNKTQAKNVGKMFMNYEIERHNKILADIKAEKETAVADLKKDWPGEYFDTNGAKAKRAMTVLAEKAGIPADVVAKEIDEKGKGNDTFLLRMLYAAQQVIGPDFFVPGADGGSDNNESLPGEPRIFKSYSGMKKT